LEILRNTFEIIELLWKCLKIMYDFIFLFFAAMAQEHAPPFPQPPVGAVRPPREPLP
jgi:hypothetical protein